MSTQQFDPRLAKKEWGWCRFGRRAGISVLLTRARWMGLIPRFYRDRSTVTLRFVFGCGELWLRVPYRPLPEEPK